MQEIKAVCFGEVLWDVFPDVERIGGAPLNVASRLSSLGIHTEIISRIGEDQKGKRLLQFLKEKKVEIENIQTDPFHPTGTVDVTLSKSGSASYDINYPSAWDKIELTERILENIKNADAFIFGSLACRDKVSRKTLFELISSAKYKIFDINLRPPHYEKGVLEKLLQEADFIKFNDEELFEVSAMFGSKYNSLEQNIEFMAKTFGSQAICVTKGSHGAVLFREDEWFYNSGYKIKVKDTVGAGDSFLASLTAKLLQKEKPQKALNTACAMGALVAGSDGANPGISHEKLQDFMFPK